MKLQWLLMAEGLGRDAKNALTAIGLNQNVVVAPTLPHQTKRAVVAHIVDLAEGDEISIEIRLETPSGEVATAVSGRMPIGAPPPIGLEDAHADVSAELAAGLLEYGRHRIVVVLDSAKGEHAEGELALHVVERPLQRRAVESG